MSGPVVYTVLAKPAKPAWSNTRPDPNGIRRRALVVLLTLAAVQVRRAEGETETLVHVAELLGELQSYGIRPTKDVRFEGRPL